MDSPVLVVGIGSSAGGLQSISSLLSATEEKTSNAYIIVQHLSPKHPSMMPELLARYTHMPVHNVTTHKALEAGAVYLVPPGRQPIINEQGELLATNAVEEVPRHPINHFFKSLAKSYGKQAVAIVLSGSGSDGSSGVGYVYDSDGLVLVEGDSASFTSMPQAAMRTKKTHASLLPEAMPTLLNIYSESYSIEDTLNALSNNSIGDREVYRSLLTQIKSIYGLDFSSYKQSSIQRRIERRMSIHQIRSLSKYQARLHEDQGEMNALYQDILIGVTDFLRDPDSWVGLYERALAPLIQERHKGDEELRVWITGCSTGEEAYTAAQIITEKMEEMNLVIPLRIFATDVNEVSLRTASAGVYASRQVAHLSPERRHAMFIKDKDQYIVRDSLRKLILFSKHNLLENPPFGRIDLTICRNMLIYFNAAAQRKAMSALHFSLRTGGVLFLGNSESIGELETEYKKIHRANIFLKTGNRRMAMFPPFVGSKSTRAPALDPNKLRKHKRYESFLEALVGDAVIVDPSGKVQHLFGEVGRLLTPVQGPMNTQLSSMCPVGLGTLVNTALKQAHSTLQVVSLNAQVKLNEERYTYKVQVVPAINEHQSIESLLVRFEQTEAQPEIPPHNLNLSKEADQRVLELEQELHSSQVTLQTVIEELEMTNEELQSSNEELHANLEELQSTNEELHSVNEELYSVNSEYESKLKELSKSRRDQDNLMHAVDAGVIFVDTLRCLRFFSPAAKQFYNFRKQDLGRDLADITTKIEGDSTWLIRAIDEVLEGGEPIENHTQLQDQSDWSVKIKPYINTEQEESEGVVITLNNISELQKLRRQEAAQREALTRVLDHVPLGIWETNAEGKTTYINRFISDFGGVARETVLRDGWNDLIHPEDLEEATRVWGEKRQSGEPFHLFFRLKRNDGQYRWVRSSARPMFGEGDQLQQWYGSITDVHDLRQAREKLERFNRELEELVRKRTKEVELSEHRLMLAGEHGTDGFWDWNLLTNEQYLSPRFKALFGYADEEMENKPQSWMDIIYPEDLERAKEALRAHLEEGKPYDLDVRYHHKDGSTVWVICRGAAQKDEQGRWARMVGTHTDITALKRAEHELQAFQSQMLQTFQIIVEHVPVKLWRANAQGERTYFNRAWQEHTGKAHPNGWLQCIHPDELLHVRTESEDAVRHGSSYKLRYRLRRSDGSYNEVYEHAIPYYDNDILQGYVGAILDADGGQASYAQKLSVLAGGIAHDFNNILTGIIMPASLGKMDSEKASPVYQSFDTIERSAHRAAELCRLLMDASGGSAMGKEVVNLETLTQDSLALLSASKRKSLTLEWNFEPDLSTVEADLTQLQRVIMNIALNAIDSLDGQQGIVSISGYSRSIPAQNPTHLVMHDHLKQGDYVVLEIRDTGKGIPQSNINRIFDPFFTTKSTGRGLGLAAARGSIKALMGGIEVESTIGEGTSMRVWLPAMHLQQHAPLSQPSPPDSATLLQGKKFLIVDDEPILGNLLAKYLGTQKAQTEQASNGKRAIDLCKRNDYDAVILDYAMPGMLGDEVAQRIRDMRPKLPIVMMSGYSVEHMDASIDMELLQGFVQKPFDFDKLNDTLAQIFKHTQTHQGT